MSSAQHFHLGQMAVKRGQLALLLLPLPVVVVLAAIGIIVAVDLSPQTMWESLSASAKRRLVVDLLFLGAVGLGLLVQFAGCRASRLQVDDAGITLAVSRWSSIGLARPGTGNKQIAWDEIRRATLEVPPRGPLSLRLTLARLVLHTEREQIPIAPFIWLARGGADHRLGLVEAFGKAARSAGILERAPLLKLLRARGLAIESTAWPAPVASRFDLFDHRGLRLQLALLTLAGAYALVDWMVTPWRPLGTIPVLPFWLVAAAAVALVVRSGAGAPAAERVAVALLTIAACVAAVYPAMLRINAAGAAPLTIEYVSRGAGRFEPPDAALPPIDLSRLDLHEYREQYPPGSRHDFTIVKGALGFYQLDTDPLFENTHAFYAR